MGKRILVFLSGRNDGSTNVLCDEFINGAKESGNYVEKILVNNKNINYICHNRIEKNNLKAYKAATIGASCQT